MTFEQAVFYVFAGILVFAATMVITIRNPVKAALFLVLAFFSAAGLWVRPLLLFLSWATVKVVGHLWVLTCNVRQSL